MFVRQHINLLETVKSHYCRRDSKKLYRPQDLSVAKMYRFYLEYCAKLGNQCDFCVSCINACDAEKEKLAETYENHLKNKNLVQQHKEIDIKE